MEFKQAVESVLKYNYANFSGRASRSEYWWYWLFTVAVSAVFGLLGMIFTNGNGGPSFFISFLSGAVGLALIIPGLAVSVRRMHDIGKGGGWIFINCIPAIGNIWFLILCLQQGEPGPNRFGPQPY